MKIAILLLAAGKSTRMTTPKQLLSFENSTLLEKSIIQAQGSKAGKVFCVLGAYYDLISKEILKYNIEVIRNSDYENGISSSITTGIFEIEKQNFDAALIILGDQPKITSEYLNVLIANFKKEPDYIFASNYDGKNGVPAIFPKTSFSHLLQLKEDSGAYKILNSSALEVKILNATADLTDIDTREDYRKLIQKK